MKTIYNQLSDTFVKFIDHYAEKAFDIIDEEEKLLLKSSKEEELIFFHFTLGIYLRCRFNLWKNENHILQDLQNKNLHPDEIFSLIIYRMWQKLKADPENH